MIHLKAARLSERKCAMILKNLSSSRVLKLIVKYY